MFSVDQKRQIAEQVQRVLRATNHPELPEGEIAFHLHVDGAEAWSWADIRNNGAVSVPGVNPWNELQAKAGRQGGVMAKKRNYKTRKHTHQLWITARAGIAIVDFGREGVDVHLHQVGTRRKNAIRLACSVGGCRAYRFAYFNLAGEFIRFGDIRYEGKAGQ